MRDARRVIRGARRAAPLLLFLLTGCGSDRPYTGPPPGRPYQASAPAAKPTVTAATPAGPPDPLIGDGGQIPADPLMGRDPLLSNDPLRGSAHPIKYTHWLRGRLHDARMTVLLNGVWYGTFSGVLDREINVRLRQGTNTVKFMYQPNSARSAGNLEIVESEHHPPLTLVTFRSQSSAEAGGRTANGDPLKPVTQTFPFVAN